MTSVLIKRGPLQTDLEGRPRDDKKKVALHSPWRGLEQVLLSVGLMPASNHQLGNVVPLLPPLRRTHATTKGTRYYRKIIKYSWS